MKVVFLNHETKLGGAELMLLRFLQACDRNRFDPAVLVAQKGEFVDVLRESRIPVYVLEVDSDFLAVRRDSSMLSALRPFALNRALKQIRQCVIDLRAEVVVSNSVKAHVYGSLSLRRMGTPYGWRLYDIIDRRSFGRLQQMLLHGLARRCPDSIACVSEAVRKPLSNAGIPDERLKVVYSGIDADRFAANDSSKDWRKSLGLTAADLVVMLPGRIMPSKGHGVFVEAARLVVAELPTVRFLIAGESFYDEFDYEAELRAAVAKAGLSQHVEFLGFQKDMRSVYSASDIVVVPSLIPDSLPTVILEAMAAERIVIGSDIGGAAEIITDGQDGFLVPPGDAGMLARKILDLTVAHSRWIEIGRKARNRIELKFNQARYVQEMHAWLEILCKGGSGEKSAE